MNHDPKRHSIALLRILLLPLLLFAGDAMAQHPGDIGLGVADGRLKVDGPIGAEDANGIFYGVFGDTGFPGYTSNPGFDAFPGTFAPGRIGFNVLAGLRRWDMKLGDWETPTSVPERMSISFITLERVVEDEPMSGFDLAVQPNGGWHRHLDFEILGDASGERRPGVYRLDLSLYSTMGIADSDPFVILFNYDASNAEVDAAIGSFDDSPPCPGDFDGNGVVDGADFGSMLGAFGTEDPELDLDGDGTVGGADVGLLLGSWGICP
ncbi:MAG: hypothetical protein CMJ27_00190 [Phycisphaerae bacterium]|nr:hypothetical protein [Phycisphaerae bacterium]OUX03415.1 MAG: hypothetical protein CBD91_00185 [Phycisphaeraceae bacterium TMED231]